MKHQVTCEECGDILEENGIYDLAQSILRHINTGNCDEMKKALEEWHTIDVEIQTHEVVK